MVNMTYMSRTKNSREIQICGWLNKSTSFPVNTNLESQTVNSQKMTGVVCYH